MHAHAADPSFLAPPSSLPALRACLANAWQLPKDLARRMREYLNQQKAVQLKAYAAKSLPALSPALQIEVSPPAAAEAAAAA